METQLINLLALVLHILEFQYDQKYEFHTSNEKSYHPRRSDGRCFIYGDWDRIP